MAIMAAAGIENTSQKGRRLMASRVCIMGALLSTGNGGLDAGASLVSNQEAHLKARVLSLVNERSSAIQEVRANYSINHR